MPGGFIPDDDGFIPDGGGLGAGGGFDFIPDSGPTPEEREAYRATGRPGSYPKSYLERRHKELESYKPPAAYQDFLTQTIGPPEETVYKNVLQALHVPAQGLDEIAGFIADEPRQAPGSPGGTSPGAAGALLRKASVASPTALPGHLARGAAALGVPGGEFAKGAMERLEKGGSELAADPSSWAIPGHPAVAATFLPAAAESAGMSAGELWAELEANGFKPTKELGAKLAATVEGAAFLGLLGHGVAEGAWPKPKGKAPAAAAKPSEPPPQVLEATAKTLAPEAPKPEFIPDPVKVEAAAPAAAKPVDAPAAIEPAAATPTPIDDLSFLPEPARAKSWEALKQAARDFEGALKDRNSPQLGGLEGMREAARQAVQRFPEKYRARLADNLERLVLGREKGEAFLGDLQDYRDTAVGKGRQPFEVTVDPKTGAQVEFWSADGSLDHGTFVTVAPDGKTVTSGLTSAAREVWVGDPKNRQYKTEGHEVLSYVGGGRYMDLPDYTLESGERASGAGPVMRAAKAKGVKNSELTTEMGTEHQKRAAAKGLDLGGARAEILKHGTREAAAAGPEVPGAGSPVEGTPGRGEGVSPAGRAVPGAGELARAAEPAAEPGFIPDESTGRSTAPPVVPSADLEAGSRAAQEGALTVGPAKAERNAPTVKNERYESLRQTRQAALDPPGYWQRLKETFAPTKLKTYLLDRMAGAKQLAGETQAAITGKGPATKNQLNPYDIVKLDPRIILDLATNTAARPAWLTEVMHTIVSPLEKAGHLGDVKMLLDYTSWGRRYTAARAKEAGLRAKLPMAEAGQAQRRQVGGATAGLGRRREQLQLEGAIKQAQESGDKVLAKILKNKRDDVYRARLKTLFEAQRNKAQGPQLAELVKKLSSKRIEELVKEKRKTGFSQAKGSVKTGEQKLGKTYHQLRELLKNAKALGGDAEANVKALKKQIEAVRSARETGSIVPRDFTEAEVNQTLLEMQQKLGPERFAAVQEGARKIQEISEKLLDQVYNAGIISDRQYEAVKALGEGYVPLFRLQKALAAASKGEYGTGNLLSLGERRLLQKFEGSKLDTLDPMQATYLGALRAFSDLAKQEAATSLVRMHQQAAKAGLDLGFRKLKTGESPATGKTVITRWNKGKPERWELPGELTPVVEALKDPGPRGLMLSLLEHTGGLLRAGAVGLSLPFTARNIPRDFGRTIYMVGKYLAPQKLPKGVGARTTYALGKWVETMVGLVTKNPKIMEQYQDALWNRALGGTLSFEMAHSMGGATPTLEVPGFTREKKGLRQLPGAALRGFTNAMSAGAKYTEATSKLMAWRMLQEQARAGAPVPKNPKVRAWIVNTMAGTPPSNVRGTIGREGNVLLMFANVAAQGWRTSWERTLRDPKATVGRTLLSFTALATALTAWNNQVTQPEDPSKPEWDKLPADRRRDYWIVLSPEVNPATGRHQYLKLAKPEFVKAFYNVIENVILQFSSSHKPEWAQVGADTATELGNPLGFNVDIHKPGESVVSGVATKLNPALKAPVELAGNKQSYTGTPIETAADLEVAPPERYDSRTSPTMVLAGRAFNLSPKKLEYLTRTFGAGFAESLLSLTDLAAKPFSPQVRSSREGAEKIPILSALVRTLWDYGFRDAEREKKLETFYQRRATVAQALATYERVKKSEKDRGAGYLGEAGGVGAETPGLRQSLHAESVWLDEQSSRITDVYRKLRQAPTNAAALQLNQKLNQILAKIEKDLKRREAGRKARELAGRPPGVGTVPPPGV